MGFHEAFNPVFKCHHLSVCKWCLLQFNVGASLGLPLTFECIIHSHTHTEWDSVCMCVFLFIQLGCLKSHSLNYRAIRYALSLRTQGMHATYCVWYFDGDDAFRSTRWLPFPFNCGCSNVKFTDWNNEEAKIGIERSAFHRRHRSWSRCLGSCHSKFWAFLDLVKCTHIERKYRGYIAHIWPNVRPCQWLLYNDFDIYTENGMMQLMAAHERSQTLIVPFLWLFAEIFRLHFTFGGFYISPLVPQQ